MARLIVDAVSSETKGSDAVSILQVFVSVSRADTGESVTGLTKDNFRICSTIGNALDPKIGSVYERKWETADVTLSGVYQISIQRELGTSAGDTWAKGEHYGFGIQAHKDGDKGQTVVSIESLGT